MAKLAISLICLLAISTISAMPLGDDEKKEPSAVVPLEKMIEKTLGNPSEDLKTETILPNQQLREAVVEATAEEEKKVVETPLLKKVEEEKNIEQPLKEEKKVEMEPQVEEKKMEKLNLEEKKTEDLLKVAPSEKKVITAIEDVATEKKEEIQERSETSVTTVKEAIVPVAEVQPIPAVGASGAIVEVPQTKSADVPIVLEKKSEEHVKEVSKIEEKPEQRVTRGTEDALPQGKKIEEKKVEEKLFTEVKPEKIEPVVAEEKHSVETPTPVIPHKENHENVAPAIEAAKAEITEEPKKLKEPIIEQKPTELSIAAVIVESVKPIEEAVAPHIKETFKSEQLHPAKEAQEAAKEQRSEDAVSPIQEVQSVVPVVAVKEVAPVIAEAEQTPVTVEKSAKSADEIKAEELPKPQEVKESKIDLPKVAEQETMLIKGEEMKSEDKPLADMLKKEEKIEEIMKEKQVEKKEEKKDSSEEESSSEEKTPEIKEEKVEEKKLEKKKDEKQESSEEKYSSEEIKLEEKKIQEINKPAADMAKLAPAISS